MALKYVVTKRVFGFDKEKKEKYVIKPLLTDEVKFDELCIKVSQVCGIHRTTVRVVLDGMMDTMTHDVKHGFAIRLGDFGCIRPAVRATCAEKEEELSAHNVYRRRLIFTPGRALKGVLGDMSIRKFEMPDTDYTGKDSDDDTVAPKPFDPGA